MSEAMPPRMTPAQDAPPPLPEPAAAYPVAYAPYVKPSAWPKVIGIISIVIGGLGLLQQAGGLVASLAMGGASTTPPGWPQWAQAYSMAAGVAMMAASGLLIAAGVQLVRRRPVARTLHLVYGLAKVLIAIVALAVGLHLTRLMLAEMTASASPPPGVGGMMEAMVIVGVVIGFLIGVAYPVFLFIWFSRKKIRQQVAAWRSAGMVMAAELVGPGPV